VQIAQGQNTVTFPVSAVAAGQVSISAALPNQPPTSASLTVQPAPAALSVVQVTLNPNPAAVGTSVTGTVVLSGPAVAGTTVALASGNTQVATVQQAVVTPTVGQNSAQFQVAAIGAGTTDIRASLGTSSQISTLTVEKPKETKEGKERKDTKEKEKEQKEKEKDTKEKDTKEAAKDRLDKLQAVEKRVEKVRDLQEFGREPNIPGGMGLAQDTRLDQGQAFIRPAERPAIGQDFQVQALDGG
jgi:hypothetical protein